MVLILISTLVVAVPVLFVGGSKKEELHGTWINEEYKGNYKIFTYDDLIDRVKAVISKIS